MTAIVRPLVVHPDERGSVREAYRESWFPGVPPVRQVVHSESGPNVMRAMHAHKRQYDIWHFTRGKAQVQLYDHRTGYHEVVYAQPDTTIVIPPGVSHGFYTREGCTLVYMLTEEFDGTDEFGWYAGDPDFPGATWWLRPPSGSEAWGAPVRSQRDIDAPSLAEFVASW